MQIYVFIKFEITIFKKKYYLLTVKNFKCFNISYVTLNNIQHLVLTIVSFAHLSSWSAISQKHIYHSKSSKFLKCMQMCNPKRYHDLSQNQLTEKTSICFWYVVFPSIFSSKVIYHVYEPENIVNFCWNCE